MRKLRFAVIFLLALAFAGASFGTAQETPSAPQEPAAAPAEGNGTPALTKADVDAWLDGFIPYALSVGDIAGAVVVVVKDGRVLTERGFGFADVKSRKPVDPQRTLFRPGSVSKLLTWTAVMQQVEAGKLDLDADVNTYLDFKIPPRDGKPVTLRNLMTHTPGFGEQLKGLFVIDPKRVVPLGTYLSRWTPPRIFAPGEVPAYSNYGAGVGGYLVERVSGEPFASYVEKHIFEPLGMSRSSFRQPLPEALMADMATGYRRASMPAKPYEMIPNLPAGSLSATGSDMGRFMLAHLQGGQLGEARILGAETAKRMHAPSPQLNPPLNPMALGFYHEDRNGHQIVGHGGDTEAFHSDLHLLIDDGVGLFISVNSAGKAGAPSTLRAALLRDFMDRYFPASKPSESTLATAKEHGALMAASGPYWSSRRSVTGFFRFTNLMGQVKVLVDGDGLLLVPMFRDAGGAVVKWREVAPFVWKDASGDSTLAAVVKDGRVVNFTAGDLPPVMVFQPVPAMSRSTWNMPLLYFMVAMLILAILLWPVVALLRRHYGKPHPWPGKPACLHRLTRLVAIIDLAALGVYMMIIQKISAGLQNADVATDPLIRAAQALCVLGSLGAIIAVWNMLVAWGTRGRTVWSKLAATLVALACVAFVWFVATQNLVTLSLNY
jgi:CubicO group peptidase (beta-lactamase class C family)